jgi:MFS family permease
VSDAVSPARDDPTGPAAPEVPEAPASLWSPAFVVVTAIQFVNVLANGSTTMALPSIQSGLGATSSDLQWFASVFALSFSMVLVLAGRLGDLFGARRLLMIGYGLFVVAIKLEGIAPGIYTLLAARVLQGLAGGLMAPQLSAVIQRTYHGHSRTRAFAVYLTAAGAGFAVGQLLGGALMASDLWGLGWRWAFLPFVLPSLALWFVARRTVPHLEPEASGRLDVPGALMVGVVSILVMFPLIKGRSVGWPVWIFVILAAAVPVFVAFLSYQRRLVRSGGSPLVNPELFRIRTFRVGNTITLLVGLIAAAVPLYLILTVQIGFGKNPFQAALIACPMPLANMAGSLATAPLLRRFGRLTIAIGAVCTALAAVAVLVAVSAGAGDVGVAALVPGFVLVGFALGISIAAAVAIVLSDIPASDSGSAAGVQSTGLQMSSAIGIAVYGVAFYGAVGGSDRLQPYLDGLVWVMWITIAFAAVQVLLMFGLPRHSAREQGELPLADPELLVFPDLHGDVPSE